MNSCAEESFSSEWSVIYILRLTIIPLSIVLAAAIKHLDRKLCLSTLLMRALILSA